MKSCLLSYVEHKITEFWNDFWMLLKSPTQMMIRIELATSLEYNYIHRPANYIDKLCRQKGNGKSLHETQLSWFQSMLVSMCMRVIFILFALWHDQPAGAFLSIPREKLEVSKLDVRRRRWWRGAKCGGHGWCYETTLGKPQHASQSSLQLK